MKRKIITTMLLTWLTASMIGIAFTTKTANATLGDPWLEVTPNEYKTAKLETFNIEIWLNDVTADKRLIGVQFRLKYNATLLTVLNVTEGAFLPSFNNTYLPPYTVFTWHNETNGLYGPHVIIGDILLPEGGPYTVFPEGSGLIATITFQGIYPKGNCTLELVDTMFTDDNTNLISTAPPINGYYEILFGDVNHDKKVDIWDIAMAAQAFGSYPGHSRWDPRCDINNDNKNDIRDLLFIIKNFGQTLTDP